MRIAEEGKWLDCHKCSHYQIVWTLRVVALRVRFHKERAAFYNSNIRAWTNYFAMINVLLKMKVLISRQFWLAFLQFSLGVSWAVLTAKGELRGIETDRIDRRDAFTLPWPVDRWFAPPNLPAQWPALDKASTSKIWHLSSNLAGREFSNDWCQKISTNSNSSRFHHFFVELWSVFCDRVCWKFQISWQS